MHISGWLGKIAEGQYETEIVSLQMTNGSGDHFDGQGLLSWETARGVRIEALTNGADALLRQFGQAPCPLGDLIPDDYYLKLEGRTRSGEAISVKRISPIDYNIHTSHSTAVWKIPQSSVLSEVTIRGRNEMPGDSLCTEMLLSPASIQWPRPSTTTYENPHFGGQFVAQDWLEFECSLGKVVAQGINSDLARVRVLHLDNKANVGLPLGLAFSFLASKTVNLIAKETVGEKTASRTIYPPQRPKSRNQLSPPLRERAEFNPNVEQFLSKAVDFFSTDTGKHAGNLLHMCFGSVDSTFSTNALVVCVALESMIKLLVEKRQTEPSICDEQKKSILAHLNEVGLGEHLVGRFSTFIGKIDETSPKNVLHALAAKGLLGISKDDVRAWDRLRNSIAHGKLLMSGKGKADDQKHYTALHRVKNLINKLLLNAMQFDGLYYDYVEWNVKDFDCADLSAIYG